MKVLGIDPGTARLGFGLVETDGVDLGPSDHGVITTVASQPLPNRLCHIYQALRELLRTTTPDVVAVEELFFSRNVRTAFMVGQARGVILLAVAQMGLPVFEYTPLRVKQAVVGYGRASKEQVQEMVRMLLSLPEVPKPDDAADALAVAICHVHSTRLDSLVEAQEAQ